MIRTALPLVALAAHLAGCASSLSGIGGTERYGCQAPEGSQCTSVSGVYANTRQGTQYPVRMEAAAPPRNYGASSIAPALAPSSTIPAPALRSNPRVLRLWIAPWEDRDGDLHEESIVHVVVDPGRWLIEHVRPSARDPFEAVRPPTTPAQTPPAPAAPDAALGTERLSPSPGGPNIADRAATEPR
jgi:conjugal transfer pilus assembly protein TraV